MEDFKDMASDILAICDEARIAGSGAERMVMLRQWMSDLQAGRLVCVPADELERLMALDQAGQVVEMVADPAG